jgi:hypothetical protein
MVIDSNNEAIFSGLAHLGFGTWTTSGADAVLTLTRIPLRGLVEESVAHTPGAHPPPDETVTIHVQRQQQQTTTGAQEWWTGTNAGIRAELFPESDSAPPIVSLPRNWRHHFIIPISHNGADNIDYVADFDIDTAGVLSGFDTPSAARCG